MTTFYNSQSSDSWSFSLTNSTLKFIFCYQSVEHKGVFDYKATYHGKGLPIFIIKPNNKTLHCYRWLKNQWVVKKLLGLGHIIDLHLTQDNYGATHIMVLAQKDLTLWYHHITALGSNWSNKPFKAFAQIKIIKLAFLPRQNKTCLLAYDKHSLGLRLYEWDHAAAMWYKTAFKYSHPKGKVLAAEFSPGKLHMLSLLKEGCFKLRYCEVNLDGKMLYSSDIILLPAFFPQQCLLLKDRNFIGVLCSNLKVTKLFFTNKRFGWKQLHLQGLPPEAYAGYHYNMGYISPRVSLKQLIDSKLNSPLSIKLSQLISLYLKPNRL